jgi:hypothetical protein
MGSGTMTGGFDGWRGPTPGGAQGTQGGAGTQGPQGAQGAQGGTGAQGGAGAQGAQGATGTQGAQGARGTPAVNNTLAAIYAFGLTDEPPSGQPNDNLFGMPSGNWRFPGPLNWGAFYDSATEYFQNRTINMSAPPAFELVSMASNLSGIGGNGNGALSIYELNDPAWGGAFGALTNMAWTELKVTFSSDATQGIGHTATEFARRSFFPNGGSPFIGGGSGPGPGAAMLSQLSLWNNTLGALDTVQSLGGYGDEERLLYAIQNGANGQWVTHWQNHTAVPAGGDGPAWITDVDGRFGRLATAAMIQSYQTDGNVAHAWGYRLYAVDGAFTLRKMLDVTPATLQFASTPWYAANGGQAVVIGATGPAGIGTPGAPAKWLTFKDDGGVLSYIPIWQ